jgi:hypothetical protein
MKKCIEMYGNGKFKYLVCKFSFSPGEREDSGRVSPALSIAGTGGSAEHARQLQE